MPAAGDFILAADFDGDAFDFDTANDTSTSTTYVTGTLHGISFAAPTSGSVWIEFGGAVGNSSASLGLRSLMSNHVRTGGTIGSGTDVLASSDERSLRYWNHSTTGANRYMEGGVKHKLTGLTPGATYNVVTVFRAISDTAAVDNRWVCVSPAFN